ncbi:flagellar biosynthesis protein FlhB [Halarsenatibacter silvermanii]|uniref:Flagellar biosynthetic protein FlhB n=1 Tax=Halarsenatibacter silvermanii TaxID=321763 RepID=A0A1G9MJG5_9FIRM|nr:flagellar biosynthesis protein FlhB [Halarsenatibacter silvermanii]SDL74274.1 flagellar biosynthetic protein FlhB [Halarsenatibacter silvermanii]
MPEEPPGEKTEDPTPKRKEEAREEGQVAKSQEFNQAFTLLGSFLVLYVLMESIIHSLEYRLNEAFTMHEAPVMSPSDGYNIVMDYMIFVADLVAPIMIASAVVGGLAGFIQVGPLMNFGIIQPEFSKLDPIKGLKNIFSLQTLVELAKSLAKAAGIAYITYSQISQRWPQLVRLTHQGLEPGLALLANLIVHIAIRIILFLIFLGILDLAYQRWDHYQDLKMTKQEVKEERKEREGDPQIKQERKQRQREMSVNRMMSDMEEADVVVTNPVHVAVALKFDLEEMEAPIVVAKGEGHLAQRIKEKAEELDIIIEEKPSLARALNSTTEIGEQIPVELYEAVAEILAFVFREEGKYQG